ncbi:MAG TPA: glycosyl hydrolase family 18 protein [Pseudonocardiaceae bacterium]|nr:glycosyl hydrolase family 18 protein [Pseudonocardiaceae bacterium]
MASVLAAAATTAGMLITGASAAPAAPTPLPAHVFAPYFEAYNSDSPATLSQESGAKYLTMAFIQAPSAGSCGIDWNGDTSQPISSSTYGSDFATIRASGGDVIPSFGGYGADHDGTEIADSCTNVSSIAAAYESVITTYNVTRLDLDTEDNSLSNSAGIDRRNKAIAMVEQWAAGNGRTVQFSYTLPSTPSGLSGQDTTILRNAVSNNARIDVVNMMTFDFYDGATHEMANDTEAAAAAEVNQLASLYPSKSQAQLWAMVGITEMIGIDDYGPQETFTTADANTIENWATSKGISTLSFWALQRDNGGCVGTKGSDSCSGVAQSTWQFSNTFEPFTSGSTPPPPTNDFSVSVNPGSGAVNPGSGTTATVGTAVTSGSAQSVSLSASGAPSGVSVSLSPASVTAGGSSTLTVSTTSAAAPGSYPITITGKATSGSHSTTYTLTVNGSGPPPPPNGLTNGGFESGMSPWTCQPGGAVVSSPAHSGSHALQVAATSSQTGECDQTITVSANASHTLTAWVQGQYAFVGVSGGASASTWTSSGGWTELTVPFTTGSSGTVTVFVHGWYGQGNVYADDFAVS